MQTKQNEFRPNQHKKKMNTIKMIRDKNQIQRSWFIFSGLGGRTYWDIGSVSSQTSRWCSCIKCIISNQIFFILLKCLQQLCCKSTKIDSDWILFSAENDLNPPTNYEFVVILCEYKKTKNKNKKHFHHTNAVFRLYFGIMKKWLKFF